MRALKRECAWGLPGCGILGLVVGLGLVAARCCAALVVLVLVLRKGST